MASSQDSELHADFPETAVQGNCFQYSPVVGIYTCVLIFFMLYFSDDHLPHQNKNKKRRIRRRWNKPQKDAETCSWIGDYDDDEGEAKRKTCKLTEKGEPREK